MNIRRKCILIATGIIVVFITSLFVFKITEVKFTVDEIVEIDDSIIDDSNCFDSSYQVHHEDEIVRIKAISKGKFEDDAITYYKNFLSYQKEIVDNLAFRLKPSKNSDYKISVSFNDNILVEVWKQNSVFRNKKIKLLEPAQTNNDYVEFSYTLQQGETYVIYIWNYSNNNATDCTIHMEQDNWVYAPYGGVRIDGDSNYQSVYFSAYMMQEIEKSFHKRAFDGWYPERNDFKNNSERINNWFALYLKSLVRKRGMLNNFFMRDLDTDDVFIAKIMEADSNISLITEGTFRRNRWDIWNKQQYFNKYIGDKRVDEYKAFDYCPYDNMLNAEFLYYLE